MQPEQVGEDEFGYMLADILKENNVNNQGMRFDPVLVLLWHLLHVLS